MVSIEKLSVIIAIIGGLVGIVGGILGIISIFSAKKLNEIKVAKEFFDNTDCADFRKSRERMYKNIEELEYGENLREYDIKDKDLRRYIAHYEFWGLMLKKKYLPIWVFDGMAGKKLLDTLNRLERLMIMEKFKAENNDFKPRNMIYLYEELKKYIDKSN